jgi:hypothetical protein
MFLNSLPVVLKAVENYCAALTYQQIAVYLAVKFVEAVHGQGFKYNDSIVSGNPFCLCCTGSSV